MNAPLLTELRPLVTQDQVEEALARVRPAAAEGGLWRGLQAELGLDDTDLAAALESWYGVVVFTDAAWAQATGGRAVPGLGWIVQAAGRKVLLTEDPWSPAALQALSLGAFGATQLALPRPGQQPRDTRAAPPAAQGATVPVVAFVDEAIAHAFREGASDIHFECDRTGVSVKFRLDGVMAPAGRLDDAASAQEVLSRIKVLAQLDITERRRPQDGRFRWTGSGGAAVDMRVSVMPSLFGEDAVLRLLDKAQLRNARKDVTLAALGFDAQTSERLRALARRPHGMLLMTGPTGSGKTTTVYAALSEVNDGLEKIITIEDPVEYELPGVLQIPVNEQKGLTFATGLRSILRHDPDKILVGEIRDAETAEIAVQSALTGHLVFTTVHANSLADVLGRFQHFGIDPFALASALNGVVVQRLLRRLCAQCRTWRAPDAREAAALRALGAAECPALPMAPGCAHCRSSGYRGRLVIAEVHEVGDRLKDLIAGRLTMSELKEATEANGQRGLRALALARVLAGATSLAEVERVVGLA